MNHDRTITIKQAFYAPGLVGPGRWEISIVWTEESGEHAVQLKGPARDMTQAAHFMRLFTRFALKVYR